MASTALAASAPGSSGPAVASGPNRPAKPARPEAGAPDPRRPATGGAARRDGHARQRQEMATRLDAGSGVLTRTASHGAYEQLPRGAERPAVAAGAREPDGRDCPHARDRATEQGST
jgi:hypothetical protein